MAPCLAPVFDERGERAAFYAVCEVDYGGADDFVAAADCEGLVWVVSWICLDYFLLKVDQRVDLMQSGEGKSQTF